MNRRIPLLLSLLVCCVLGILGCNLTKMDKQVMPVSVIDKIDLEIVGVKEMPSGILYRIMLTNDSDYTIKQNAVYLSYPIIKEKNTVKNVCKVETTYNRLNIKPGDSIMLKCLVTKENYENNPLLDIQHPNLEIKGYMKEVNEINHFEKSVSAKLPKAEQILFAKPVIYLYPAKEEVVSVKLSFDGKLGCTYPEYKNGWNVIAAPDGTLVNLDDSKEYSYLFWDGVASDTRWDLSRGFVVAGKDSRAFLQDKLAAMGLLPKEYNEFIVYWLPLLEKNEYNLITFAGKEYTNAARLKINPKPDAILRVFMVFKSQDKQIEIPPQQIKTFKRQGFTVVEWGGTELK
jgi:hypothetical protein